MVYCSLHPINKQHKVCSHLTFTFASISLSKFNIALMETQTLTHRMGSEAILDVLH